MAGYTHTIAFTKKFRGDHVLAGRIYHDALPCVSVKSARDWMKGVTEHAERNGYDVLECTVTNIETMRVTTLRR